jgi:hypothetical protein
MSYNLLLGTCSFQLGTNNWAGVWNVRAKCELRELYKAPVPVMEIERKRLEQFGECNYNGSNKEDKKMFESKPKCR